MFHFCPSRSSLGGHTSSALSLVAPGGPMSNFPMAPSSSGLSGHTFVPRPSAGAPLASAWNPLASTRSVPSSFAVSLSPGLHDPTEAVAVAQRLTSDIEGGQRSMPPGPVQLPRLEGPLVRKYDLEEGGRRRQKSRGRGWQPVYMSLESGQLLMYKVGAN
ncbi:unnamed protein product [Protopolystoma xenopodis]|uniref:PH domain-containing protein n=1 Tax=Protopolystoma xenopodis TaxID=117903 RepID=A0A3S5ABR2_9PLAT|nr:unnamed protein product [Protopolystoma xenopodis]